MKTNLTLKALAISVLVSLIYEPTANAQANTFPATGNVGIGIASPIYKLDVAGSVRLGGTGSYSSMIIGKEDTTLVGYHQTNYMTSSTIPGSGIARSAFRFKNNIGSLGRTLIDVIVDGNVGVGTSAPKAKLDVVGGIMIQSLLNNTSLRPPIISNKIPGEIRGYSATGELADDGLLRLSSGGGTNPYVMSYIDISSYSTIPDMHMNIVFGTNGSEKMRINVAGNVGIGTATPTEKLSVKGKIRAQEIKVEIANWPDYVFAKDYRLPSLQETEKHIQQKGHLPGIPSAEEVKANGVDLGEMNAKLLKKIEELTLYLINQQKEIEQLKKRK